jgi:hypothetical protein
MSSEITKCPYCIAHFPTMAGMNQHIALVHRHSMSEADVNAFDKLQDVHKAFRNIFTVRQK